MPLFSRRLFVPPCLLCLAATEGADICPACAGELPRPGNHCRRCCEPLPQNQGPLCARCLANPPAYDQARASFIYAPPISRLIIQLKYHRRLTLVKVLSELLLAHVRAEMDTVPDCLIPVPLHRLRISGRGFNQATEIARILSRRLGIPCDKHCVVRIRNTPPQTGLRGSRRRRNLRGAFAVRRPPRGRHVALIDDVMTTGTTFAEIAALLKRNGVERVEAWALARTTGSR